MGPIIGNALSASLPGRNLLLLAGIWSMAALVMDLWLPSGAGGAMPYVVLVLLGLWAPRLGHVIALAVTASFLTLIGVLFSEPDAAMAVETANRAVALAVIWIGTVMVAARKQLLNSVELQHDYAEKRFRDFAEASSDWIWETDADQRFTYSSENMQSVIGVSPEHVLGKTRGELLGDDYDRPAWEAHLGALQNREPFRDFVYCWPGDAESPEKWVSTSGQPHFDGAGAFQGYRGTGRDVSEVVMAQAALQESEAQVRLLLESTGEAIYGIDIHGRCTFANPACAAMLGHESPASLLGRQMHELIHHTKTDGTPYANEDCRIYQAFRRGEGIAVDDEVLWRRDGTAFPAAYTSFPILRDGVPIGAVVTFVDTTEKRDTLDALSDSEERFRSILENAPIAIVLQDLDARIQLVNSAYEDFFIASADQLVGSVTPGLFGATLEARLDDANRKVIESGAVVEIDANVIDQNLPVKFIRITKFPVFLKTGEISGIGTIVMDTSAQKMAEERLVQTHKMEAVGQLTGGVAHDFNNLLTAVMGNLDLLRDHLAGDEPAQKYLATAYRASVHGAELTDRLLAFSGHQALTSARIDINMIINQFSQLAARTLGKDIQIETRLADAAWPVTVDPGQLENALLNLALNARDAMSGGGQLRVATTNQVLDESFTAAHENLTPGDYVMIEVTDDGAGMSADTAARAIEPFFTTKAVGEGSGLGLSMAFG
ncbi:MAG: PAS domain S-box protein, partial [Alphaproteobacteria bacterium]